MNRPHRINRHEASESLVSRLSDDPSALQEAIEGLSAVGSEKFSYSKALMILSEQNAGLLYPYFPAFRHLLIIENRIIQWTAIRIIANLAQVDGKQQIVKIIDDYLAPIEGPVMITAANTILGALKRIGE